MSLELEIIIVTVSVIIGMFLFLYFVARINMIGDETKEWNTKNLL